MAITQIRGAQIKDREISSAKIQLSAIIEELLATNSVSTTKIVDANVTTVKLADAAVTNAKVADDAVTTSKIVDANVTTPKLADKAVTSVKLGDASIIGGAQLAAVVDAAGKTFSGAATFSSPLTVAAPVVSTDATTKGYVDQEIVTVNDRINNLGDVFSYIGTFTPGSDAPSAVDLYVEFDGANIPSNMEVGSYFKAVTPGYVFINIPNSIAGPVAPLFVNANDGVVVNVEQGLDIIDNTNSVVQGTLSFVAVTGSTDTGYTVDLATDFKDRVSTLETEAQNAQTATGLNPDGTLTAFSGTSYLDSVTSLKAGEIALDSQVKVNTDKIGNTANLTTTAKGDLVSALNEVNSKSVGDTYVRETPVGSIDGTNTVFALSNSPIASTVQVFLNGVLQELADDYTLSGTSVSFLSAPFSGDKVKVIYFKA